MLNETIAQFNRTREKITSAVYQYDKGQVLIIKGLELPALYKVDFCNEGDTVTKPMIGNETGVEIPDEYLKTGRGIIAYIVLHETETDTETEYKIRIPVIQRPEPTDIEPTPEQQALIDQLVASMNQAVTQTEEDAESASQSANSASQSAMQAGASATSAGESASAALQSATAASQSAVSASESETSARQSKEAAKTASANAGASATSAGESASSAAQSALSARSDATAASQSATAAGGSATAAEESASQASQSESNAEAWAVGERDGVHVEPPDETYQNNAKYWAQVAQQGAEDAGYAWFDVLDSDGCMYVTITPNLGQDISFLVNETTGMLEVVY